MLDIQLLRKNLSDVAKQLAIKGFELDSQQFQDFEQQRRLLQVEVENCQAERKRISKKIGLLKAHGENAQLQLAAVASNNQKLETLAQQLNFLQSKQRILLASIPNLPHSSVPLGKDEASNIEVRRIGNPREFSFPARDHTEIGMPLGLDAVAGAKLSGSRFTVMTGKIARLHRAIAQFMIDLHTSQHNYKEVATPYIVNSDALFGTGQLPKFADDMFKVIRGGEANEAAQYLISTAEITLTNLVRDSILNEANLPIKMVAHTPCFRSEAGAAGRDTRGLIRQHQFDKVELVQIVKPDESYNALEELVNHAETVLQKLELPYRVMSLCGGDLGFQSAKTYDLEVWLPAQQTYREISSCSNIESFQARRMMARYRSHQDNKTSYVHTLNGSALAVGRTLVAILENYQNEDGSVTIPNVLRPYLNNLTVISP